MTVKAVDMVGWSSVRGLTTEMVRKVRDAIVSLQKRRGLYHHCLPSGSRRHTDPGVIGESGNERRVSHS